MRSGTIGQIARESEAERIRFANKLTAQRLERIDWDFRVRVVEHEVESVHPYPAKFIADLPAAFLDTLELPEGTIIMDPFCGSGTTLAEGQRRGLRTVGIDLNPIACMIARVKTAPLPGDALDWAKHTLAQAAASAEAEIPLIPNLNHWFKGPIQTALARLTREISQAPCAVQDFLRLAVSSIIVRVSNQDSDTRYAAVDKPTSAADVPVLFWRACERLHAALRARDYPLAPTQVIEGDLLELDLSEFRGRVGMIITSPPYPNAYEYWLYHKYRMWWLGHDPISVKEREIGARAHFFGKNRHTSKTFVGQMDRAFVKFEEMCAPGAWACFVVGRSIIHGETVDNASIISECAMRSGFELVHIGKRNVLSTRKSFNLSHANIKQESLVVLRKKSL